MSTGTFVQFLAGYRGSLGNIPVPAAVQKTPSFPSDVKSFIDSISASVPAGTPSRVLLNKVKKCATCQKPNGFTLAVCNQCGSSLREVNISFTDNVFSSFMFGIAKSSFPLTISVRYQDAEWLVMDDLLALSPLHFCAIPTTAHIPDWRYLLRRPAQGLKLIRRLRHLCDQVAREQFLSNELWSSAMFRGGAKALRVGKHMACGFNFPPSQYQLHLQYISPVLLPFQYAQFLQNVHYTPGRFFPYEYVEKVLEILVEQSLTLPSALLQDTTPMEDITAELREITGVHYEQEHAGFLFRFEEHARLLSNWNPADFAGTAVHTVHPTTGKATQLLLEHGGVADESTAAASPVLNLERDVNKLIAEDKIALQNYGKGELSFYAFPKVITEVELW